jgi:TolB protein
LAGYHLVTFGADITSYGGFDGLIDSHTGINRPTAEGHLNAEFVSWSPNGEYIAFVDAHNLWAINTESREETQLIENVTDSYLAAWSLDGQMIAFISGGSSVHIFNVNDNQLTSLSHTGGRIKRLVWSPDGIQLAFELDEASNHEIYLADLDGNARNVSNNRAEDHAPTWSPTGSQIAFVSNRSGSPAIWVMDSNGENLRNLTDETSIAPRLMNSYRPIAWSLDGQLIAGLGDGLYIVTLATGTIRHIVVAAQRFQWAPDGQHIAFQNSMGEMTVLGRDQISALPTVTPVPN